jgi:hypothetical protein
MLTATIVLVLFSVGFACAGIYYARSRGKSSKPFFILVRICLLCALLLAFFEPMITFERLQTKAGVIPVLIDASASMQLFTPRRTVYPFLRTLDSLGRNRTLGRDFRFYTFGDSLRRCSNIAAVQFSDLQSLFPTGTNDDVLRDAPMVIIVSDGNFSNASVPRDALGNKPCYYVRLSEFTPRPYLQLDLLNVSETVSRDSASTVSIRLSGFIPKRRTMTATCKQRGAIAERTSVPADSGYFSDSVTFRLDAHRQGRFAYAVSIEDATDSLHSVLYFSQTVAPGQFVADIRGATPTLDRRFLANALFEENNWRCAPAASSADALFLLDYGAAMTSSIKSLSPNAILVFLDGLPCDGTARDSFPGFTLLPTDPQDTLIAGLIAYATPPPGCILVSSAPCLARSRTILFCKTGAELQTNPHSDSLPFITVGSFAGRQAIVIAGRELWRMDFFARSASIQGDNSQFFRRLLAIVKRELANNLRNDLLAYPNRSDLFEHDSIPFSIQFPADVYGGSDSKQEQKVRFVLVGHGKKAWDSTLAVSEFNRDYSSFVKLPPQPAGAYRYECSMSHNGSTLRYADSLFIGANSPELNVRSQNTVMLNQFALPLDSGNTSAQLATIAAQFIEKRQTVLQRLEIRRSWVLVSLIVAFLCAEWFVRKRITLD